MTDRDRYKVQLNRLSIAFGEEEKESKSCSPGQYPIVMLPSCILGPHCRSQGSFAAWQLLKVDTSMKFEGHVA